MAAHLWCVLYHTLTANGVFCLTYGQNIPCHAKASGYHRNINTHALQHTSPRQSPTCDDDFAFHTLDRRPRQALSTTAAKRAITWDINMRCDVIWLAALLGGSIYVMSNLAGTIAITAVRRQRTGEGMRSHQ